MSARFRPVTLVAVLLTTGAANAQLCKRDGDISGGGPNHVFYVSQIADTHELSPDDAWGMGDARDGNQAQGIAISCCENDGPGHHGCGFAGTCGLPRQSAGWGAM